MMTMCMQRNKMCSFIQTTVTQVIRIMPSFCKKHLSIKNNKNYNQNTIKRPARIEKNYYHVPQRWLLQTQQLLPTDRSHRAISRSNHLGVFLMYEVVVWFTQQQLFHAECSFVVLVFLQVYITQLQPCFRITHVSATNTDWISLVHDIW